MILDVVDVGPFKLVDRTRTEVVRSTVELARSGRLTKVYALHVGGLNHRNDSDFVDEMNEADLVYADGGSIVTLGRIGGARRLERAPTTDIGWLVLRDLSTALGRPARVALIGGEPGLAAEAGGHLEATCDVEVVCTDHGYHTEWAPSVSAIAASRPDVCIVGMGAPREMLWVRAHQAGLPPCLVLTCGGWFGFIVGRETRAPRWLQSLGLEWVARVAQSPVRLGGRYFRGALSTLVLAMVTIKSRLTAAEDVEGAGRQTDR